MKYVTFFTLFCLLLAFQFLPAQAPDTLWTKIFGGVNTDMCFSVQQTTDGGYIMAGWTNSFGDGLNDVWIVKTNTSGDSLWTKTFGGSQDDHGYAVQQTTDGGYVIVGETYSFPPNDWQAWLIKTDISGDTLWTKTFGGSADDFARCGQQTIDEGYILTGRTRSFGAGNEDVWLIKTDSSGDTLWTKTFGGSNNDQGTFVIQTADEGYIIAAITESFGAGNYDIWLIKTDSSGDTIWTKIIGGNDNDAAWSIEQNLDGGFILAGRTRSFGAGDYDIWLIKTDSSGDTLWTKTFGGANVDIAQTVCETADGGFIITGSTGSIGSGNNDVWLIKTNASGDSLWSMTLGGNLWEYGRSIQQTTDRGYIITGETNSFGIGNSYDAWLIKVAPDPMKIKMRVTTLLSDYRLFQNYPNPFNPNTTIEFNLPKTSQVTLKIYNILGEEVATLVSDKLSAGSYSYEWSRPAGIASGVYLYRLQAGNPSPSAGQSYIETRKMVLMR